MLSGRPDATIRPMPVPDQLCVPLKTKRFNFSNVIVSSGDKVKIGEVLAADPDNFDLPLLAPASASVDLESDTECITLKQIISEESYPSNGDADEHVTKSGRGHDNLKKLFEMGAWEFFSDAFTAKLPDPKVAPQAIIVSTISLEPFVIRGDVLLKKRLVNFTRGLEHLQSLIEYQQIYLVMPRLTTSFANKVRDQIRGYAWVNLVEIDLKYPYDNFNILARHLDLKSADGPVWSLKTQGVLAVDEALTYSRPCIERNISVAGPDIKESTNIRVTTGYPIKKIIDEFNVPENTRIIDGGILTGKPYSDQPMTINSECSGITLLPEHTQREFVGWMRPGFDRHSYAKCFGSLFRGRFRERMNTAIRGELRPCISCNFCEEVCPAGIMPHLLHKYLYADLIEEAERARIDLCIQCGLCTYVCTSKIELADQFATAMIVIEEEKQAALAAAAENESDSEKDED